MTPDDIQKCIHDGIAKALGEQLPPAVSSAVNTAVNGKVKALSDKMTPMAEAYQSWLSWKRLAIVSFGMVLAIGGLIQSLQALYSVASNYLTISVK